MSHVSWKSKSKLSTIHTHTYIFIYIVLVIEFSQTKRQAQKYGISILLEENFWWGKRINLEISFEGNNFFF